MAANRELKGLGERPFIMGILNITPDSFSEDGKFLNPAKALDHALFMAESGADIIDIGGESSRPGSSGISADEEIDRVMPVIEPLCKQVEIAVSIDTTKSKVAKLALEAGATIINDISGLQSDQELASLAAEHNAYLILMHMRGTPRTMQNDTRYDDLIGEISKFLLKASEKAISLGVAKKKIIIDPGIGFGKSVEGNFAILRNLHRFSELDFPLLIGLSRKAFIGKPLDLDVTQRLEGSLAAACYAILNGADIIRVHDVLETKRALAIIENITEASKA
jgi:dihydropteroate synthase